MHSVPKTKKEEVKLDVNRLHFSKTCEIFDSNKKILVKWNRTRGLKELSSSLRNNGSTAIL